VNQQQTLWHDSLEDALKDAVHTLGGPKAAGHRLWPDKEPEAAARYLNQCLDPERAEKLELSQVLLIMQEAKAADCHTPMYFLADVLGYEPPKPKNPETERERIMREYIKATETLSDLAKRMERIGGTS